MSYADDAAQRRGEARVTPRGHGVTAVRALGAVSLLAVLLAACLQPPPPPPPADPLVARADGGATPAAVVDLGPGEWVDFELVLDAVRSFDAAYLELDATQPAVVELRSGGYWGVVASSSTPDFFVRGAIQGVPQPTPGASAAELEPSQITPNQTCLGPCVVFDPGSGRFFARVVNTGSTTLVADLYLYGSDLADTNEPGNDSRGGAPALADGAFGAIELLGDVDYWLAPAGANVTVEPVSGAIALEATVYDACGLAVAGPYPGGQTFRVFSGEAVRVRATQERAAAPGRSGYYLSVTSPSGGTPPRDGGCTPVTAGTNPDSPAVSVFMGSNATATFVVSVPSSVRSRDVIQFEVGGSARLEVLGSGGSVLYSSASPDVFFAGGGALAAPSEVEPAAVAVGRVCGGPCVIDPAPASSYLVRVRNQGPARNVPLFAFGRDFDDTTEPANDSRLTAPSLTDDGSGAIEFVGDVDLWYVPFGGTVSFETVSGGLPMVVDVLSSSGSVLFGDLPPGGIAVGAGEYLRVRAADGDAAAVAGRSTYFLFY